MPLHGGIHVVEVKLGGYIARSWNAWNDLRVDFAVRRNRTRPGSMCTLLRSCPSKRTHCRLSSDASGSHRLWYLVHTCFQKLGRRLHALRLPTEGLRGRSRCRSNVVIGMPVFLLMGAGTCVRSYAQSTHLRRHARYRVVCRCTHRIVRCGMRRRWSGTAVMRGTVRRLWTRKSIAISIRRLVVSS